MNPDKSDNAANPALERQRRQFLHEEIARRAEQVWRSRGSPQGQDEAIWLEAEKQLHAEAAPPPYMKDAAKPPAQTKSSDASDSRPQTKAGMTPPPPKKTPGKLRNQ